MLRRNKSCKYCDGAVIGRSDKIFCSTICRTEFHNKNNRNLNQAIKKINAILRRNHKILNQLNKRGITKVKKDLMLQEHFNFNYFTNVYQTKKGQTYYFVYDQGYLDINDHKVTIVEKGAYIH